MDRAAKDLAEQMIEIEGASACNLGRDVIIDLLEEHGLPSESDDVRAFQHYITWLWEE